MTSFVAWVDYSSAEQERMHQAVALFKESQTVDELGLGSIRDTIADALFPGTSTIQTRLRYMLFIPWMYRDMEGNGRLKGPYVEAWGREQEVLLIQALSADAQADGVIGRISQHTLQRLPSSVYWYGLRRWGLFERDWSLDEYHRNWELLAAERRAQRRTDDRGIVLEQLPTWNPSLPPAPAGFPKQASFELTSEEARFLRDRIIESCAGSLLANAVAQGPESRPELSSDDPWSAFVKVPAPLAAQLAIARHFSVLMYGAALLYNLLLAKRRPDLEEKAEQYAAAIAEWTDEARGLSVFDWDLAELWAFYVDQGKPPPVRTQRFVTAWQEAARAAQGIGDSERCADLVRQREQQLKGPRSRFRNQRALELWGGGSGTDAMTYRWPTVTTFLDDLYRGLDRQES